MTATQIAAIAAAAACTTSPISTLSRSDISPLSPQDRCRLIAAFQEACMVRVWNANEAECRSYARKAIARHDAYYRDVTAGGERLDPTTAVPANYAWVLEA